MTRDAHTCLTPEDMLYFDVSALGQAFGRFHTPLFDPLGLTSPQYLVMSGLRAEGGTTIGHLAARRRSTCEEQRVEIGLTSRGRAGQAEAARIPACVEAATGLISGKIPALREHLDRLRRAFGTDRPRTSP